MSVSADFGKADGTSISNAATILDDVDKALGVSGPPAFEYIFCEHTTPKDSISRKIARFGHALCRYTLPDGKQVLMNIVGLPGNQMVHLIDVRPFWLL